jgi:hypothetical protein
MSLPKLETPIFELILPSTEQKIKYRPFVVKEYKTLMMLQDASDDESINIIQELIDVCTFNKLPKDLPSFDLEFIFMNIRARSIGEGVELEVTCDCGNKIDYLMNIPDLKVEKSPNHTTKIKIDDSLGFEMRYPKFKNTMEVFTSGNEELIFDLIMSCVKGVYTQTEWFEITNDNMQELREMLLNMTTEQFAKLEEFFETMPKLVHDVKVTCNVCGAENHARLEGLQNFFV